MDVGATIKQLRKDSHKSQQQIELKTGLRRASIANWENNRVSPRARDLETVLDALGYELCVRKKEAT